MNKEDETFVDHLLLLCDIKDAKIAKLQKQLAEMEHKLEQANQKCDRLKITNITV